MDPPPVWDDFDIAVAVAIDIAGAIEIVVSIDFPFALDIAFALARAAEFLVATPPCTSSVSSRW